MKVNWKIAKNPIDPVVGEYIYTVYRLRDPEKTDHSGNREEAGTYKFKEVAEAVAGWLNRKAPDLSFEEAKRAIINIANVWNSLEKG